MITLPFNFHNYFICKSYSKGWRFCAWLVVGLVKKKNIDVGIHQYDSHSRVTLECDTRCKQVKSTFLPPMTTLHTHMHWGKSSMQITFWLADLWIYSITTILCFPEELQALVSPFLRKLCFVPYIYTAHSKFLILFMKTFLSVTHFFRLLFLLSRGKGTNILAFRKVK